jgi:hypothetical protein
MPALVISLREISTAFSVRILHVEPYSMSFEMRSVIDFLWLKNLTIAEISRELDEVYGHGALCVKTVQRLVARFAAGEEGLEIRPRSGRPRSDGNIGLITQILVDDPYLSQKAIAWILSIHPTTVERILLEELSLRKVNFKWIPHHLNERQKQERARLSIELLEFLEARAPREFVKVYTGDETWVCYDNPRSSMSVGVDVERRTRVRRSIGAKTLMIWVCFSRTGIDNVIVLSEKETFTHAFFVEKVLDDFDRKPPETRPKKRARMTFLHLDNASRDRADDHFDRLGITRLSHQPYGLDLAPFDFWLFANLKTKLEGNTSTSAMQQMAKINEIVMDIPLREFISAFDEWIRRLVGCIEVEGDYL